MRAVTLAVGIVLLDLAFMTACLSPLAFYGVTASYIQDAYGVGREALEWGAIAFSVGLFAAFLIGHSKAMEARPKLAMAVAALSAGVPQVLIPYAPSFEAVVALRFVQGLAISCIPVFSAQTGLVMGAYRTIALGVILGGIFLGGTFGSVAAETLPGIVGWRTAYVVTGALILLVACLWLLLTPSWTLPRPRAEARPYPVWRRLFTIIWGFSFFPALWVIFTLSPIISFVAEEMGWAELKGHASTVLHMAMFAWSIAAGCMAYALMRRGLGARWMFKANALVMAFCYALAAVGCLLAPFSRSYDLFLVALVLVAALQGAGPAFWSTPSIAYPRDAVTRAGYALGLISNSANAIGPVTTQLIKASGLTAAWLSLAATCIIGLVLTLLSLKLRLPVEEEGGC